MTSVIIALCLVGAVMAVAGVLIGLAIARLPKLKSIPGWSGPTYISKTPGVDGDAIARAMSAAVTALRQHSTITEADIWAAANRVTVIVQDVDAWVDRGGQRVGGEESNYALVVDMRMASLCHELCHAIEEYVDAGRTDAQHVQWKARGFWAADDAYRTAMK